MFDRPAGPAPREVHGSEDVARSVPKVGHEIVAPPHVGAEMQRLAVVEPDGPGTAEPAPPVGGAPRDPAGEANEREAEIAAQVTAGRYREATAACAAAYGRVLGRLCMALVGAQADADEAVQETLLRAHRGMAAFRGDGSVKAWLCGIARHVCAHMLESRRRGREVLELAVIEPEAGDGVVRRRRARAIRRALDQLRPSERDALVLRYVAELSHRELAAALQLDEAAARKRISRALAHLRTALPAEEIV